jgi:hypothetical protein
MRLHRLSLCALALALATAEARADHVFTLSDVTFNDGGTATGTFTTDDALNSLVSFDITTSPGTDIGFHYTPATAGSSSASLPFILVLSTPSLNDILELTFTNLTAAGAPITLGATDSFEQTPDARRTVVAGAVVAAAVPEPSSVALAGTAALVGLGLCMHRRAAASRFNPPPCSTRCISGWLARGRIGAGTAGAMAGADLEKVRTGLTSSGPPRRMYTSRGHE